MSHDQRTADLERSLRKLADEAQILVNIIKANTDPVGRCTLDFDMTVGTRSAIEDARKLVPVPKSE